METKNLIDYTLMVLKLLVDCYNAGSLTLEDFHNHSKTKIRFVQDNFNFITQQDKKEAAEKILQCCANIMRQQYN